MIIIPSKLKVIAGFKAGDDVTMEQIQAALEKAHPKASPTSYGSRGTEKSAPDVQIQSEAVTEKEKGRDVFQNEVKKLEDAGHSYDQAWLIAAGREPGKSALEKWVSACNAEKLVRPAAYPNARSAETRQRQISFQQLLNEREQQFANETSDARFAAVAASEAGQSLLKNMHKPEAPGEKVEKFDERLMNDSKTLFKHLVEQLALEPKWRGQPEMVINDFAATKHPQGKVWYDMWQHQEDLQKREELAARQKSEAPHLHP
jgi:hypothetical protein